MSAIGGHVGEGRWMGHIDNTDCHDRSIHSQVRQL